MLAVADKSSCDTEQYLVGIARRGRLMVKALNVKELSEILSVSQRHVWRLSAAERLPRPVRMGRSVRWLERDIQEWLDMRCPSRAVFEKRRARKHAKPE